MNKKIENNIHAFQKTYIEYILVKINILFSVMLRLTDESHNQL